MPGGDVKLQLVIDLAQSEIADQFAWAVGRDGQAIGFLLVDSALVGTIIAAASIHWTPLDDTWVYPLVGLVVSAGIAFAATTGRLTAGPQLSDFNQQIQTLGEKEAQEAAITDLLSAIEGNRAVVRDKEGRLGLALILAVITFLAYGLYAVRDLLGAVVLGLVHPLAALVTSHGSQVAGVLLLSCIVIPLIFIYAREG
jgi:hypothetical protein